MITTLMDGGHSYESAARVLGISPGLVYMIATGHPADRSDPPVSLRADNRVPAGNAQQLANPAPQHPTRRQEVNDWVRGRAMRELAGRVDGAEADATQDAAAAEDRSLSRSR